MNTIEHTDHALTETVCEPIDAKETVTPVQAVRRSPLVVKAGIKVRTDLKAGGYMECG